MGSVGQSAIWDSSRLRIRFLREMLTLDPAGPELGDSFVELRVGDRGGLGFLRCLAGRHENAPWIMSGRE